VVAERLDLSLQGILAPGSVQSGTQESQITPVSEDAAIPATLKMR
jgi:hypothetical protein